MNSDCFNVIKDLVVSLVDGLFSQFVAGLFLLLSAWYIYKTENKKAILTKKHEIALSQLVPNLYTPLLIILDECEGKEKLKRDTRIDYAKILKILDEQSTIALFCPITIQIILGRIRDVIQQEGIEPSILQERVLTLLRELRVEIRASLQIYAL